MGYFCEGDVQKMCVDPVLLWVTVITCVVATVVAILLYMHLRRRRKRILLQSNLTHNSTNCKSPLFNNNNNNNDDKTGNLYTSCQLKLTPFDEFLYHTRFTPTPEVVKAIPMKPLNTLFFYQRPPGLQSLSIANRKKELLAQTTDASASEEELNESDFELYSLSSNPENNILYDAEKYQRCIKMPIRRCLPYQNDEKIRSHNATGQESCDPKENPHKSTSVNLLKEYKSGSVSALTSLSEPKCAMRNQLYSTPNSPHCCSRSRLIPWSISAPKEIWRNSVNSMSPCSIPSLSRRRKSYSRGESSRTVLSHSTPWGCTPCPVTDAEKLQMSGEAAEMSDSSEASELEAGPTTDHTFWKLSSDHIHPVLVDHRYSTNLEYTPGGIEM